MEIKVFPKIGESLEALDNIMPHIEDGIEIQCLGNRSISEICGELLNRCKNIKEVTIHPYIPECNVSYILLVHDDILLSSLKDCIDVSLKYNIKVNLVVHGDLKYDIIEKTWGLNLFECAHGLLKGTNVTLLIENIPDICMIDRQLDSAVNLVKQLNSSNIKLCLDTCHVNIFSRIYKLDYESKLKYYGKGIIQDILGQVHFNSLSNNDGIADEKTHSTPHTEEELLADMKFLEDLGVTDVKLVTEILEDDYVKMENTIKEIKLVNWYRNSI